MEPAALGASDATIVRRIDGEYGMWRAANRELTVEYRLSALDEIRGAVAEGFHAAPRGGIEIGGVLYGRREGNLVQITGQRPLLTEHALGPAFVLSERDENSLRDLIGAPGGEAGMDGVRVVGWYHSRTRADIGLTDRDIDLHNRFFPQPWQVALVLRPHPSEPTRAAFFVRGEDGSMPTEPDREFVVRPHQRRHANAPRESRARPSAEAQPPEPIRMASAPAPPAVAPQAAVPPAAPAPAAPKVVVAASRPRHRSDAGEVPGRRPRWPWLVALAVFLAAIGFGGATIWLRAMPERAPQAILLRAVDSGGQLLISWDRTAQPILRARRAVLEVADGGRRSAFELDAESVSKGSVTYARQSPRVDVRMRLVGPAGEAVEEVTSYFGQPAPAAAASAPAPAAETAPAAPAPAAPAPTMSANGAAQQLDNAIRERDQAREEVEKLRRALGSQAARNKDLEQALRVLRRRLDVEAALRSR